MIYIRYKEDIRKILSFLIFIMLKKKTFLQYLFWTFDVYKKENLLEENIKKFGQWNFILLKRHYYYLVKSVFTMFLSLLCFVWLIMMTYNQYSQHLEMFFILTSFYVVFTLQWVWVSIWYMIYAIKHSKVIYKEIDIYFETDNKIFLRFVNLTMISFVFQIIIWLFNVLLAIFYVWDLSFMTILNIIWQLIINIVFLTFFYNVFKRLVDFNMDFTTVSPLKIVAYSQEWIQNFSAKDLATDTIKSVTVVQSWFFQSVFNIWRILIKWIWDETSSKEYSISLNHIKYPEKVKEEIDFVRNKREIFIDK